MTFFLVTKGLLKPKNSDHFRRSSATEMYCNDCYVFHKSASCVKCAKPLVGLALEVDEELYHPDCFRCLYCESLLSYSKYFKNDGAHTCSDCFQR